MIEFDLFDLWRIHIKSGQEVAIAAMQARLNEEIDKTEIISAHLDNGQLILNVRILNMTNLYTILGDIKVTYK